MEKIDISLKKLNDYFCSNNYVSEIVDDSIIIKLSIEEDIIDIMVRIPIDYPFNFLEVYLPNYLEMSFVVPHMIRGHQLCLFESGIDRHDYKNYLDVALETVQRAEKLLLDSKHGLMNDYEFYELWTKKEKFRNYFVVNDYEIPTKMKTYFVKKLEGEEREVCISTDGADVRLLVNLSNVLSIDIKRFCFPRVRSLYLPINNKITISEPIRNFAELDRLLRKTSYYSTFCKFIVDSNNEEFKLLYLGFSTEKIRSRTVVALIIPKLVLPKKIHKIERVVSSAMKVFGNKEIRTNGLTDLSEDRILNRSGDGRVQPIRKSIYLTGCGSLGSYLSKNLNDSGVVKKFILQDNQLFSSENIGRHLCGIESIDQLKVVALEKRLLSNNPNLPIETLGDNFNLTLLGKNDSLISKNYDLLVCATGEENHEEELLRQYKNGTIKVPILLLWVEPYLVAGHAILVNATINKKAEDYIFDSLGNIKIGIIEDPSQYAKSEAGCQSRFMPYSGFEMQQFTMTMTELLTKENYLSKKGIFHFMWLGKMRDARKNGIHIKNLWRAKDDRELFIRRIDE